MDGGIPEKTYVAALLKDLEMALPQIWGRKVESIFFGGGTPSLLSGEALDDILTGIRLLLPLEPGLEITLEANPGAVESGRFEAYRAAGVSRLSLGIQSFNPRHLKAIGRIHDDRDAFRAIELAQQHFDNINLDLMYALPGQTQAEALVDIRTAVGFQPQHLSAYHLTIEPNTWFHHHPPVLPDDDESAQMQEEIESLLDASGYLHYETSAFSLVNQRCRHNLNYWLFGDYLGIGAGAHGKLSLPDGVVRQTRPRHPQAYMLAVEAGRPVQEEARVDPGGLAFEFMMNALRLNDGFRPELFSLRTGLPLNGISDGLQMASARGLLDQTDSLIRPTIMGRRFLNDLLAIFLPEK